MKSLVLISLSVGKFAGQIAAVKTDSTASTHISADVTKLDSGTESIKEGVKPIGNVLFANMFAKRHEKAESQAADQNPTEKAKERKSYRQEMEEKKAAETARKEDELAVSPEHFKKSYKERTTLEERRIMDGQDGEIQTEAPRAENLTQKRTNTSFILYFCLNIHKNIITF